MYFVKTRNWHCKRWVKFFLDLSRMRGVKRADCYEDEDGKYVFETANKMLALFTWRYFMIFYRYSGGWTYVHRAGMFIRDSDPSYA
jgi:hypothetical protein